VLASDNVDNYPQAQPFTFSSPLYPSINVKISALYLPANTPANSPIDTSSPQTNSSTNSSSTSTATQTPLFASNPLPTVTAIAIGTSMVIVCVGFFAFYKKRSRKDATKP
jgi:hypothetical protein